MKRKYTITIEVDETEGQFITCEGCIERVFNETPNTKDTKPIKVLKINEVGEQVDWTK